MRYTGIAGLDWVLVTYYCSGEPDLLLTPFVVAFTMIVGLLMLRRDWRGDEGEEVEESPSEREVSLERYGIGTKKGLSTWEED